MSKTTEQKTVLTEEERSTLECLEKYFPVVGASTLSTEDEAFKYEPNSKKQKKFKKMLFDAIESGLSDFRAQKMDPSFDYQGRICFGMELKPAVGKSANWWKENAEKFMPAKRSRIGTTKERIIFLGFIIKYLIEEKDYSVENAWKAVCDQSKDLGHYRDSKDSKHDFETTGSREIGKWNDLANTYKITVNDEFSVFSVFGGDFTNDGNEYPLADIFNYQNPDDEHDFGVAWMVMDV